ncbi:alpha/beta hydrolase [Fodinicurvata halophila]|uniref:alpha/beta hydrolase n=1 Tax=Fodinicurvata halophila TaxID=1419723 RepID=UPI00362F7E83
MVEAYPAKRLLRLRNCTRIPRLHHHCFFAGALWFIDSMTGTGKRLVTLTKIKIALLSFAVLSLICIATLAALIGYGSRPKPEAMPSIAKGFESVDYSTLPQTQTLQARDGTRLAYRHYPGDEDCAVLALHGSATEGRSFHALARELEQEGVGVYVPDLRGHGESGREGDIPRRGVLENDIEIFIDHITAARPEAQLSLLGFSSGGGLRCDMRAVTGCPIQVVW